MLGFIIRSCLHVGSILALKSLYYSYVRSKLEYCCLVWNPYYSCYKVVLERVQRRFLKYIYFRINGSYPSRETDQVSLLVMLDEPSLYSRRVILSLKFLYKLLHNDIDSINILSQITFIVPRLNSRTSRVLHAPHARSNVMLNSPLSFIAANVNKFCIGCDLNADSLSFILSGISSTMV